jgi:hypothetical protein
MTHRSNSFRLTLCVFSGEDCTVIRKSSPGISSVFAAIGFFVILIFFGCFVSAYDFSFSLFQGNRLIGIPVGIIWALLVVNMYLLLLYTVSPAMLPIKNKKKQDSFFTLSMFFRIVFMSLLAIIIAQPLNVLALSSSIEESLHKHVQQERSKMIIVADSLLIKKEMELFIDFNQQLKSKLTNRDLEQANQMLSRISIKIAEDKNFVSKSIVLLKQIEALDSKIWGTKKEKEKRNNMLLMLSDLVEQEISSDSQFLEELHSITLNAVQYQQEFQGYKTNLYNAIQAKIDNYNNLDTLLSKSNFYIKRIQLILYERQVSWFITTIVVLLFLLPIYFKYKVREKTDFYTQKLGIEKMIINEEYETFKVRYSRLLQDNVKNYNMRSLADLTVELQKLQTTSQSKYEEVKAQITEEFKEEIITKYVYWADDPFRTIHKFDPRNLGKQEDFLRIIYNEEL